MVKQRLFVTVLVLQSTIGDLDDSPIVDHQVRIIRAPNAKSAYTRAIRLGEGENSTSKNPDGQVVTWAFLGLPELDRVDESQLSDGGELFSWRTRGPGRDFVREREQLAVFAPKTNETTGRPT